MAGKSKNAPEEGSGAATVVADRADMLCAAQVASVVDRKSTIPVLMNMVVEASGEQLAMTATDLDMTVRVEVPARCEGSPLSTTIAAQKLAALIGAADDGCQIALTHDVGGRDVVIKAPGSKFKMPVLPREDFPLVAFVGGPLSFSIEAKALAAVLARTADAESDEHSRYYLCGTALSVVDGRLLAVATNGHILVEVDLAEAPGDWPQIILPSKLTGLLARLLKDAEDDVDVTLDQGGARIRFEWGNWAVTSKLIDGTFPDWRRIVPPLAPERRLIVDSAGLQRAIGRVSQMSGEKTRSVTLEVEAERVTVACSSPENGDAEEVVAASSSFGDFKVRINAAYLRDIAASASNDTVALDFGDDANVPIRVEPQAGGRFTGVIMPMRL